MRSITQKKADSRQVSKPPQTARPPVCHRCGEPAPKRGRMSAAVEDDSGKVRKLYLCAPCCSEIGSVAALIRSAEESERELERQRFQTRRDTRPADRRAA